MSSSPYQSMFTWRASIAVVLTVLHLSSCAPPKQVVQVTSSPVENRAADRKEDAPTDAGESAPAYPVVEVPPFEGGRMWTFDRPPLQYLETTYNLEPDSAWLARARSGALRFADYCSASFVSEQGLVMTNHHCARESIEDVSRTGETLLDSGFVAQDFESERRVRDLFVEQLVRIEDVTEEVHLAARDVRGVGPQADARERRAEAIERRYQRELAQQDSTLRAEIVALYSGGRYAAYIYRRFSDVRLVMAPELEVGYFGGDPDNFEYPRHTFDVAFFRVYQNDVPYSSSQYYRWDNDGLEAGDAVFAVGNPGTTSRMSTLSQLEYLRDHELPTSLDILERRRELLASYLRSIPAVADSFGVRSDLMSLENTIKSQEGQLKGLTEGNILPMRYSAERRLRQEIQETDSLRDRYGSVFQDLALVQQSKKASAARAAAFTYFLNPAASSRILSRAMYGYVYQLLSQRGAPPEQLKEIRKEALAIESWPRDLEAMFIAQRLRELRSYLGENDPTMRRLLGSRSPESLADSVAGYSALVDSSAFRRLLDEGFLSSDDVAVDVIGAIAPLYFTLDQELRSFSEREDQLEARLAMARFAVFGQDIPPDATFTLRLSDGRVSGYASGSDGVEPFTTIAGMYSLQETHPDPDAWDLPPSWEKARDKLDLSTPLNLVATTDITGGSSGSALLDAELEVVGIIFDGNLASLPNEFVYSEQEARAIAVDARAILAILEEVYRADRIVAEIVASRDEVP